MNLHPSLMNNSVATQQQPAFYNSQQPFPSIPISQWDNNSNYHAYQLPLQLSQYYNVFPEVPSTKTSWTFPNGCVTSDIVRFTGSPTPSYPSGPITQTEQYKASGVAPTKRKSLVPDNETTPSKIFITEEKMAARMSGMHISNEFISYNNNVPAELNTDEMDDELENSEVQNNNNDSITNNNCVNNSTPQLVICDELKNLNKEMHPMIPESLMPLDKPTTALVLWRPPASYINVVKVPPEEEYKKRSSVVITDITDRPDLDNNNISSVDLNSIAFPNVEYPPDSVEVMDM